MYRLRVTVHLDANQKQAGKCQFERVVDADNNLAVNYSEIIRTLFFLFGGSAIININVLNL